VGEAGRDEPGRSDALLGADGKVMGVVERSLLVRAIILSPGSTLLLEELGEGARGAGVATTDGGGVRTLEDVERDHILRVLESRTGASVARATRRAGSASTRARSTRG
jgi:hypothetical protein